MRSPLGRKEWILGKDVFSLKRKHRRAASSIRFLEVSSHFVTMRKANLLRLPRG